MHADAPRCIDPGSEINELPGVRAHLPADMVALQSHFEHQVRLGGCNQRKSDSIEGDFGAVHIIYVQKVPVPRGAEFELVSPRGKRVFLNNFLINNNPLLTAGIGCKHRSLLSGHEIGSNWFGPSFFLYHKTGGCVSSYLVPVP